MGLRVFFFLLGCVLCLTPIFLAGVPALEDVPMELYTRVLIGVGLLMMLLASVFHCHVIIERAVDKDE